MNRKAGERRITQLENAARATPTFHFSVGFRGFYVHYFPDQDMYNYYYRNNKINRANALRILASQ